MTLAAQLQYSSITITSPLVSSYTPAAGGLLGDTVQPEMKDEIARRVGLTSSGLLAGNNAEVPQNKWVWSLLSAPTQFWTVMPTDIKLWMSIYQNAS